MRRAFSFPSSPPPPPLLIIGRIVFSNNAFLFYKKKTLREMYSIIFTGKGSRGPRVLTIRIGKTKTTDMIYGYTINGRFALSNTVIKPKSARFWRRIRQIDRLRSWKVSKNSKKNYNNTTPCVFWTLRALSNHKIAESVRVVLYTGHRTACGDLQEKTKSLLKSLAEKMLNFYLYIFADHTRVWDK